MQPILFFKHFVDFHTDTNLAELVVNRDGAYGSLSVDWTSGYPSAAQPPGFQRGLITPEQGTVNMDNGVDSANFRISVCSDLACKFLL